MPVFEPSAVSTVITTDPSAGSSFIVKFEIDPGDVEAVLAFYEDWFSAEGMEIIAMLEIGLGGILAKQTPEPHRSPSSMGHPSRSS